MPDDVVLTFRASLYLREIATPRLYTRAELRGSVLQLGDGSQRQMTRDQQKSRRLRKPSVSGLAVAVGSAGVFVFILVFVIVVAVLGEDADFFSRPDCDDEVIAQGLP